MTTDIRPTFIIVGAAKSGTTSLFHYLGAEPEIFVPRIKEPHYFVSESIRGRIPNLVSDSDRYYRLFNGASCYNEIGEASVFYLYYHDEAIPRILEELGPDTKIIISLRDPISRAYSSYLHCRRFNSDERCTFEEALEREQARMCTNVSPMLFYQSVGRYTDMVAAYMNAFEKVQVVLYDDLYTAPDAVYSELVNFLGITQASTPSFEALNVGGNWYRSQWAEKAVKRVVPPRVRVALRYAHPELYANLSSRIKRRLFTEAPSMSEATRQRLREEFASEVRSLEQLIGRNLATWLRD